MLRLGRRAEMKATQQLKNEHEDINVMLNILEHLCRQLGANGSLNREHFDGILEFFKVFVDRCHHGKEEALLFPALIISGLNKDTIVALTQEHETGRNYINSMSDMYVAYAADTALFKNIMENALAYISLLRGHIKKENALFLMADSSLSEITQDELAEGFERMEAERVGKHEDFQSLIEKLREIYIRENG
jgi:hemerythrin-like domain-containing protein